MWIDRQAVNGAAILAICCFVFAGGVTAAADTVPLEQARTQIETYQSEMAAMRAELDGLYGYESAPKTMETLLSQSGVDYAMRYTKDWGNWMYVAWDNVELYDIHSRHLSDSLSVVQEQGFATAEQMAYLEEAMAAFREEHEALAGNMEAYANLVVERGLITDEIQAMSQEFPEIVERELEPELAAMGEMTEDLKAGLIVPYRTKEVFSAVGGECYTVSWGEGVESEPAEAFNEPLECGEFEQELADMPDVDAFMDVLEGDYIETVWEDATGEE